jgi:hypothetical protein
LKGEIQIPSQDSGISALNLMVGEITLSLWYLKSIGSIQSFAVESLVRWKRCCAGRECGINCASFGMLLQNDVDVVGFFGPRGGLLIVVVQQRPSKDVTKRHIPKD